MPEFSLDDTLAGVFKPGRYIGEEWNSSRKDFGKADLKFALCFPDLYEVGMSNLGLRILYGILNREEGLACERFFSPTREFEESLRSRGTLLFSLESKQPLKAFDIVGFSLAYELCYTNVLAMLDLGGIPLDSSKRDADDPLVIAGGPCALNPEPMHEFFDLFLVGEAEEAVLEIAGVYRRLAPDYKAGRISRRELLCELAKIGGVYVPGLYKVSYNDDGTLSKFLPSVPGLPEKIVKRYLRDLNSAFYPVDWIVPYIEIVHDRLTLEVMRGCPNKCRFCQATVQYHPWRLRSKEIITDLAARAYSCTGYEEISLSGLSVSDYPHVQGLVEELTRMFAGKAVGISLPSVKPRAGLGNISQLISTVKKTGLTFAPEAASEKLRLAVNKKFDMDNFFRTLEESYAAGYQRVKLYFMIGLPGEEESDLAAIIKMADEVSQLRRKVCGRSGALVSVSVNTLIPKPHAFFERIPMLDENAIRAKQDYLRSVNRNRNVKLAMHDARMSLVEGVISRGDRRLSGVIREVFLRGARFQAWEAHFNPDLWFQALQKQGLDPSFYLRERPADEILPWSHIDMGVGKESRE